MKLSLQELKRLVNQEIKTFPLQEKRKKTRNEQAAMSEDTKEDISYFLEELGDVADESEDPDELRWYLSKVYELFGIEPVEREDEED